MDRETWHAREVAALGRRARLLAWLLLPGLAVVLALGRVPILLDSPLTVLLALPVYVSLAVSAASLVLSLAGIVQALGLLGRVRRVVALRLLVAFLVALVIGGVVLPWMAVRSEENRFRRRVRPRVESASPRLASRAGWLGVGASVRSSRSGSGSRVPEGI